MLSWINLAPGEWLYVMVLSFCSACRAQRVMLMTSASWASLREVMWKLDTTHGLMSIFPAGGLSPLPEDHCHFRPGAKPSMS